MHKKDIFGRRIPKGIPPVVCHFLLWGGFVLFIGMEVFSLQRAASLDAGHRETVGVAGGVVDAANEGRIVHVSGELRAARAAVDPRFGDIGSAAFLRRTVEMRQWKPVGPRQPSTFGLSQTWSAEEIDSRGDGTRPEQVNGPMPFSTKAFLATEIRLGEFAVDERVLATVTAPQAVPPTRELAEELAKREPGYEGYLDREWVVLAREPPRSPSRGAREGKWPAGAIRLKFTEVPLGPLTVVALQHGKQLLPFQGPGGSPVMIARTGIHPMEQVFQSAQQANRFGQWSVRILACGMIFAGLHFLMKARERIRKYGPDYFGDLGE